jgi:uncharacterized membrane protein YhaH (DUF805 family)
MAVDLFDMLVQILQISPTLVNEYQAQGTIYQLFYLFFFPMVFIVLLIYVIMRRFSDNRGLSILVGIAVLAFIILNGWYTFFAYLSRFWIILLVIIGFVLMWFYHKEKGPAETGKGRAVSTTFGGLGGQITKRLYSKAMGIEKELEGEVERAINAVERSRGGVETTEAIRIANDAMLKYREAIDIAGTSKFASKYRKYEKKLQNAIKKHGIDMKKV